ncbi:double-strand break repair protein AddB [Tistrella bauzanensis]|uniref:Double-strand break repair protein AddB n=1 Tax=Tistrella bauzanensis TaxID=657419 RepID=A0ABQ1ID84_9PROT|nr:double-strand break repair protein AddB [Tistrella bauzanensis]GGB34420.1 double-strand break repair protein AddB [Tistrella bauzanensis]
MSDSTMSAAGRRGRSAALACRFPSGVWRVPAGIPFLDVLARGLIDAAGGDPERLGRMTVLLPTRRAIDELARAFLVAADGRAALLPRLKPLGDVEADELMLAEAGDPGAAADILALPPAMSPLARRMRLARLIERWSARDHGQSLTLDEATRLADALARLLDEALVEDVDLARLDRLVPEALARHWQEVLAFVDIIRRFWPEILAESGAIDAIDRRNRLLRAEAARLAAEPPADPVIIAGSTGSQAATRALIRAVAGLPQGAVVLPALDETPDADTLVAIRQDPTHPQNALTRLVDELGLTAAAIPVWPAVTRDQIRAGRDRRILLAEAFRPAETTDRWANLSVVGPTSLDGLDRLDAADPRAEATAIAVAMRAVLQTPEQTAILVTPDRRLARRVTGELRRWGLNLDDSAGRPLMASGPAVFLDLIARAAAERLAPVPLLALVKHPLAAGGLPPGQFRAGGRLLERTLLRGPRPAPGMAGLRAALDGALADTGARDHGRIQAVAATLGPWIERLDERIGDFAAMMTDGEAGFDELLDAHVAAAEALAETGAADLAATAAAATTATIADDITPALAQTGAERLWRGEAGEALMQALAELRDEAGILGAIPVSRYPALLSALLSDRTLRPRWRSHPRLQVLGPLEARLLSADLVILGGANEGGWPRDPGPDPWLSPAMRRQAGFPPAERRTGLAAHDMWSQLAAPRVLVTRSAKVDGTPTVPSRWLLRLDAVIAGAGLTRADSAARAALPYAGWARSLDVVAPAVRPGPPAPCPPVDRRPRRLSVTQIETLMRDPYAVYARHVLGLEALDPVDADPGAAERGRFIHAVLDRFVREVSRAPAPMPVDAEARLLNLGRAVTADLRLPPAVIAFWWPRFERIARWFVGVERARRTGLAASHTEIRGSVVLDAPGGPFRLTAVADRIDRFADGSFAILDYKTGSPPSGRDIQRGIAPQLPLEALILDRGGFDGIPAATVSELAFWRLSGRRPAGAEIQVLKPGQTADALIAEHGAGFQRLIATFDRPDHPYMARPRAWAAPRYSDYVHLARVKEWQAGDDSGEEG